MRAAALTRAVAKPGRILARRKHFLTLPPSVPARPHPQPAGADASAPLRYGWGDWFLASVMSSFVAWPFVATTDALWGEVLLPLIADNADASTAVAAASIIPKATASYFGAQLYGAGSSLRMQRSREPYDVLAPAAAARSLTASPSESLSRAVPHAWWFWKLSLLPALPLNLGLTLAIHMLSNDGAVKHKVYDDWLPMRPSEPLLINTAWRLSSAGSKGIQMRLCEAAPRPVQLVLEHYNVAGVRDAYALRPKGSQGS